MIPIEKQIIDSITKHCEELYSEWYDMCVAFGSSDDGSQRAFTRWAAATTILENVEELVNQQNNKSDEAK